MRDRAFRVNRLRQGDSTLGADWAGMAVASWPIGATQTAVGQAGKGAEQNQIKGQEQGGQGQGVMPTSGLAVAPTPKQVGQG